MSLQCDGNTLIPNWFRFTNDNGTNAMISTTCPGLARCNTASPGWMNGSHPKGKSENVASIDDNMIGV